MGLIKAPHILWSPLMYCNLCYCKCYIFVHQQEVADREIAAFPRDAHPTRLHGRCVVTSRPRAVSPRWRVSRIIWRHLADYNKLSGVTRAWW